MSINDLPLTPGLELRHLRAFMVLADELHFGRASVRLGLSQPSLSLTIQRMEERLGARLLDRTRRRVQLTEAGRTLHSRLGPLLSGVDSLLADTIRTARGERGRLIVAFAASVMFHTLPTWIGSYRALHPEVSLELRELPTGLQLAGLRSGTLDVGFLREPAPDPEFHFETVMEEELVIALSGSHPLAQHPPRSLDLRALKEEPFILFPAELAPGLHRQVMSLCEEAGFTPRVVQESRELYTTVSLVEAGIGVTVVPASIQKMGWRGVHYLPIPGVRTRIDMAWRARDPRPVVLPFVALVRDRLDRPHDEPAKRLSMSAAEPSRINPRTPSA
jgi:DNA-binding transcriptional LysR family regulator